MRDPWGWAASTGEDNEALATHAHPGGGDYRHQLLAPVAPAQAATARIKDIVNIEGIRDNQLVGYGLVVGLNGTGDSLNNSPFTRQSLAGHARAARRQHPRREHAHRHVAAVMVTANLPAFSTQARASTSTSPPSATLRACRGGTLLVTPLLGADGEVYAIAQGSVTINGFKASGDAATVISGVPTTGRISSGGLIEREIAFTLGAQRTLRLALKNPDLTTARRVALSINDFIGTPCATPEDPATVRITLPQNFNGNIVDLLTDVEQLVIETDQPARSSSTKIPASSSWARTCASRPSPWPSRT